MAGMTHGGYGRGDYGVGLYGTDENAEFPLGPLKINTEFYIDGAWVDVTPQVRYADSIQNKRGRQDEGSVVDFATSNFQLNNRDGVFSPRNPLSPYFGKFGRSIPVRHSARYGARRLIAPGNAIGGATTADSAALSITGDIDLRFDGWMETWISSDLMYKYGAAGQRSYWFYVDVFSVMHLTWSADGTAIITANSTVPIPLPHTGRMALRVTLDVNNGAAGNTTTFYYADTLDAADGWTQLGDPVVKAGTTSIFDSTAGAFISLSQLTTQVYGAQVISGIGGTVKAYPDFSLGREGSTSLVASTGETWLLNTTDIVFSNQHYRFWGEVSALPVAWDTSGQDSWVNVSASGPLRRLSTRAGSARSTLTRGLTTDLSLVGYWPVEDAASSTQIASGISGKPMQVVGTSTFATFTEFDSSSPIATVNNATWIGNPNDYSATNEWEVRFLFGSGGALTNGAVICRLRTGGTAVSWDLVYTTAASGSLNLIAYAQDGTVISSTGATAEGLDGKNWYFAVQVQQQGADVFGQYAVYQIGNTGYSANSFFAVANTVTKLTGVTIDPNGNLNDVAIGQISASFIVTTPVFATDLFDQALAYNGRESAAGRINRLCDEESVTLTILGINTVGINDGTSIMGAQTVLTFLDLLRETERTDQGILFESLSETGLVYRPRVAQYNRLPTVRLSYTATNLDEFAPTDDDQNTANYVTVSRTGGSSYLAVQETGPLNVSDPTDDPDGVGVYPLPVTVNTSTDPVLADHASWRLRQGTVDQARYPQVGVNLANPSLTAALLGGILALDVGDRLLITDPPAGLPPDDITLVVQGWTERISSFGWEIEFNCTPESSWTVGVYGAGDTRYSSDGSTLNESISTSAVSFQVATPSGPVWGHGDGDFDINIGGERMSVTAISGSTSPQTFTVTRSVNGIVKTHLIGDTVELWRPAYYGL